MNNIIERLSHIYQKNFRQNSKAWDYCLSRGISKKTILNTRIGFCSHNIGYQALKKDFSKEQILESGAFSENANGDVYDMLYNRLIIPIIYKNNAVYLTSRTLTDHPIKHMHQHGKALYTINHDIIEKSKTIILVEGSFDCLTMIEHNLPGIGLLGAHNLSKRVIADLLGKNVFIVFDNEENQTGSKAALKIAKKLTKFKISSKIVELPYNGEKIDVNSFFLKYNKGYFLELLQEAKLFNEMPRAKKKRVVNDNTMILPIANHYLELRKYGNKYKAVCPFHKENEPSLVIYEDTNSFYCFGCGQYGNAINLIQKIENSNGNNISYQDAVKISQSIL